MLERECDEASDNPYEGGDKPAATPRGYGTPCGAEALIIDDLVIK